MWPGRAASSAGLVCRRAPWPTHQSPCPGALASSARCWLPGAPSCGSFIHIIVSNLLMQAVCKYKKGATWVHIEIHLSTPACCLLPAFQEEMWQLCYQISASSLRVFVIGASSPEHRYCWLFVFLRHSTCVLSQQSAYTALGLYFSGLWKHDSLFQLSLENC